MARLFGTDGVRGLANRDLTPRLAMDLGDAAARVLVGAGGIEVGPVIGLVVGLVVVPVGVLLTGVGGARVGASDLLVLGTGPRQGVVEGLGLCGQGVELEGQRGRQADAEGPTHLGADQPLGRVQSGGTVAAVLVAAVDRVEDRGLLQITGDTDIGDGDESQTRVLDAPLQEARDSLVDTVGDLAGAGGVGHGGLLRIESGEIPEFRRCGRR